MAKKRISDTILERKKQPKKKASFRIDIEMLKEFKNVSEKHGDQQIDVVEAAIKNYIDEKNEEKNAPVSTSSGFTEDTTSAEDNSFQETKDITKRDSLDARFRLITLIGKLDDSSVRELLNLADRLGRIGTKNKKSSNDSF